MLTPLPLLVHVKLWQHWSHSYKVIIQMGIDNDPKHQSRYIGDFFTTHNITWWKTPPESPDMNPIENVQGPLKQYL